MSLVARGTIRGDGERTRVAGEAAGDERRERETTGRMTTGRASVERPG